MTLKEPVRGCRCGCCETALRMRERGEREIGCFCQHAEAGYDVCGCDYCLERGREIH